PFYLFGHFPTHEPTICRQYEKVVKNTHAKSHNNRTRDESGHNTFYPFILMIKNATGTTNITPAKKFAKTPIGSPSTDTAKKSRFLTPITMTPAIGEKINAAIKAGTSLKSIFK